jgi:putative membrane protein
MIHLLGRWLVNAVSLLIVAYIIPGFYVRSFGSALIAALVIGLVDGTLGAVILFLTWPFRILTLGLLTWVINAFLLWLASKLVPGFEIHGAFAALFGALLLAIVNAVLVHLLGGAR